MTTIGIVSQMDLWRHLWSVDNGEARGTTPCVLLGRYIQVNEKGKVVHTGSVVGREPSSSSATSDIDVLKSYSPQITNFEVADNSVRHKYCFAAPK